MSLISKTIVNLVNGVSQQPPTTRNPTQCEAQENLLSDSIFGVVHRPHFQFVKTLWDLSANPATPYVHTIKRDSASRFKVVIKDDDLKVFDLDGVEKTVTFPNGKGYLNSSNPQRDFQCLTLGSKTYVLNRTSEVDTEQISDFLLPHDQSLIYIKKGEYSTNYKVTVAAQKWVGGVMTMSLSPTTVTKTTSDTAPADIRTNKIRDDLVTLLNAAGLNIYASVIPIESPVIYVYPSATSIGVDEWYVQLSVTDSKDSNSIRLIKNAVQNFSDLPAVGPNDYIVRVIGDKTSAYDDYYVKFRTDSGVLGFDLGTGAWEECAAFQTEFAPDGDTMPWALIEQDDGTFIFDKESWNERAAGDFDTNPDPSFVGSTINYMFTYADRLGFLSGDRVVMSEAGVFTNFYLTTVTTFLDSDPIDIQPIEGHEDWLYAVPHAEKVILFSSRGQAVFSGDQLLTPKSAQLRTTTNYPTSGSCVPIVLGENVFFPADNGDYSRVYEYFVEGNFDNYKAAEITAHVPKYLPKGIFKLAGDDSAKVLLAIGSTNTDYSPKWWMYVYKYYWSGDQKLQSSWSRWKLPGLEAGYEILDADVISSIAHLVVLNAATGEIILLKMDLDFTKADPDYDAVTMTHLDLRVDGEEVTSAPVSGVRTFELPFDVPEELQDTFKVYLKEDQSADPRVSWGVNIPILEWVDDHTITVDEDVYGDCEKAWLGFSYESLYTFSEIHVREDYNGVPVPVETGKLSLRRFTLIYNHTFYFRVEVTPKDRDTRVYPTTPYTVGEDDALEDVVGAQGSMTVPVNARNHQVTISVINDSVVPHRLQSAEWAGQYTIQSRRT